MSHLFGHFAPCRLSFSLGQERGTLFELFDHVVVGLYQTTDFCRNIGLEFNFFILTLQLGRSQTLTNALKTAGNVLRQRVGDGDRND